MPTGQARTTRTGSALLVGLTATALVAGGHLLGLDRRAELPTLDFRFRHFSSAPDSNDLVHIDIDDSSLAKLGRWPWPRQQLAGLVEVVARAGARAVALDIILPEPQEVRFVSDLWDLRMPEAAELLDQHPPLPVFDDLTLAEALQRHGHITVPMHIDPRAVPPTPVEANVRELLTTRPTASLVDVAAAPDMAGKDAESLQGTYFRARSLESLERFSFPASEAHDYPLQKGTIIPPLFLFAEGTRATGFVTFMPDVDGTIRRIPLLLRSGDRMYPQFALTLAAEMVGTRHGGLKAIQADRRHVRLRFGDGSVRTIPTGPRGNMLINWAPGSAVFDESRHVSATAPGAVWQEMHRLQTLETYFLLYTAEAGRLVAELLPDHAEVNDCYFALAGEFTPWTEARKQSARCRFDLYRAVLFDPAASDLTDRRRQLAAAEAAEQQAREKLRAACQAFLGKLPGWLGSTPDSDPRRRQVEALRTTLTERLPRSRQEGLAFIEKRLAELRPLVEGKLALIGSTATGAADFVPTPVAARLPGVVVHANIINTIASGAFVTDASPVANAAVILVVGVLISLLGARLPVFQAGPLAVGVMVGYAALNLLVVFWVLHVWLALVAPAGAAVAAFLAVTAYRQMTEERAKRHIRSLFAHTLSRDLVDQLLDDPSQLAPRQRELSCFFSDLTSFTRLAERLGEQNTIALLRKYFDRMTAVIQTNHKGYLSKFLGDGILGFFGAPVAQPDHTRRALAAAVDCLREVRQLNGELAGEFGGQVELSCRVGISAGPVMFGDCGSTERSDYTAIGDYVNLASRLETANKQFGTRILVDARVWSEGGDESLLARPLGKILVVGKVEPVAVWNVIGLRKEASDEMLWAAEQFLGAVERFARRDFAGAAEVFQAVLDRVPNDRAAEAYLAFCREYAASPPPDDWPEAIQLTEK